MANRIWGADAALEALLAEDLDSDGGGGNSGGNNHNDNEEAFFYDEEAGSDPQPQPPQQQQSSEQHPVYFGIPDVFLPSRAEETTATTANQTSVDLNRTTTTAAATTNVNNATTEANTEHSTTGAHSVSSFPVESQYVAFSAVRRDQFERLSDFNGIASHGRSSRSSTNPEPADSARQNQLRVAAAATAAGSAAVPKGKTLDNVKDQQPQPLYESKNAVPSGTDATPGNAAYARSTYASTPVGSSSAAASSAAVGRPGSLGVSAGRRVVRAAPVIVQSAAEMLRQRRTATAPPPVDLKQLSGTMPDHQPPSSQPTASVVASPGSAGAAPATAASLPASAKPDPTPMTEAVANPPSSSEAATKSSPVTSAESPVSSEQEALMSDQELITALLDLGFESALCEAAAAQFGSLAAARRWCVEQSVEATPSFHQASEQYGDGAYDDAEFYRPPMTSIYFTFSSDDFAPPVDSISLPSAATRQPAPVTMQRLRGATASMVPPEGDYLNMSLVTDSDEPHPDPEANYIALASAFPMPGGVESVYQNIPWEMQLSGANGGGYQAIPWVLPENDTGAAEESEVGVRTRARSLSSPNVLAVEPSPQVTWNQHLETSPVPARLTVGAGPLAGLPPGFAHQAAQKRAAMLQRTATRPAASLVAAAPKPTNPHVQRAGRPGPGAGRRVFVPPKAGPPPSAKGGQPGAISHPQAKVPPAYPAHQKPKAAPPAYFAQPNEAPRANLVQAAPPKPGVAGRPTLSERLVNGTVVPKSSAVPARVQHPHAARRPASFVPPPRAPVPKVASLAGSQPTSPGGVLPQSEPTTSSTTRGAGAVSAPSIASGSSDATLPNRDGAASAVSNTTAVERSALPSLVEFAAARSAAASPSTVPVSHYELTPRVSLPDDAAVYRDLKDELDSVPSSRCFHVKVIFPATFPVVFKTLRLCLHWPIRDCVLYISHHMKFSAASRSGTGLKLSVFAVDAAHNTMRGDRTEGDAQHVSDDGVLNPVSTVNDVAHLIKANAGAIEYGYYTFGVKNPLDEGDDSPAVSGKRLDDEPADSWREQPHAGMWSHPELGSELVVVTDALMGKGYKQRWCTLQHNKLFMFSVALDPMVIRRHLAAYQKRMGRERAEKSSGAAAKPAPRELHELDPTDPRLNPIDSVYLFGAQLWLGTGKPPPPGTPIPQIDPSAPNIPVISFVETVGAHAGRITRITANDAQTLAVWLAALQQAVLREESRAHAVTHKFHVDERLAQRLGLQLSDLLSQRDPTTVFENATKIGKGGLASVFRARNKLTKEIVALKVMRITSGSFSFLVRELLQHKALSNTAHDDDDAGILRGVAGSDLVVAFRDAYFVAAEGQLWIELEFMDIGALTSVLSPRLWQGAVLASPGPGESSPTDDGKPASSKVAKLMPEPVIAFIAKRLLLAIHWLHRFRRLHRDLKSDNVLIKSDGSVKLADFGFVADIGEREVNPGARSTRNSVVGTPYWMAPEVINGSSYGSSVDIWSFGITLIECAQCVPPLFRTPPGTATAVIAKQGILPLTDHMLEMALWSTDFLNFLELTLQYDPRNRADAVTLLAHPFLQKGAGVDRRTVFRHLPVPQ